MRKPTNYFENIIFPMLKHDYPIVMNHSNIMILGSAGLGIDDSISDFEAVIYLEEDLWKSIGRELQLSLNKLLNETNEWSKKGSIICVHPISWLLDWNYNSIKKEGNIPWEKIETETLFSFQHNTIILDNGNILNDLRYKTAAVNFPLHLWKKMILKLFHELLGDHFEFDKCVKRNKAIETNFLFGNVLYDIVRILFLISHQYYPWRTHITWALSNLPIFQTETKKPIDRLCCETDWDIKVKILDDIILFIKNYIVTNNLFPEIDWFSNDIENELLWGERLSAWENPDWRNFIIEKKSLAVKTGYPEDDFWAWSLWG